MKVAVTYFPDRRPNRISGPFARVAAAWANTRRMKQNPRSSQYMAQLVTQELPESGPLAFMPGSGDFVHALRSASEITLLWPDSIGYGWLPVERVVFRHRAAKVPVSVLTGRRRHFVLTPSQLLRHRLHRMLERLCLGELVFTVGFVVLSPFLLAADLLRNKR